MGEAIFLSAAVPDPRRGPEYSSTADTVAITAAVSALVHVVLGRRPLIWGGQPAITPMILVVAEAMRIDYGQWVHLYQSRFFEDEFPEDNAEFANVTFTEAVTGNREASLEAMRVRMFSETSFGSAVFIGGMGGIIDEYELFRRMQPQAMILPVAATGGATLEVVKRMGAILPDLADDRDYVTLFHHYLGVSVREKRYARPSDQPKAIEGRFWQPGDKA